MRTTFINLALTPRSHPGANTGGKTGPRYLLWAPGSLRGCWPCRPLGWDSELPLEMGLRQKGRNLGGTTRGKAAGGLRHRGDPLPGLGSSGGASQVSEEAISTWSCGCCSGLEGQPPCGPRVLGTGSGLSLLWVYHPVCSPGQTNSSPLLTNHCSNLPVAKSNTHLPISDPSPSPGTHCRDPTVHKIWLLKPTPNAEVILSFPLSSLQTSRGTTSSPAKVRALGQRG